MVSLKDPMSGQRIQVGRLPGWAAWAGGRLRLGWHRMAAHGYVSRPGAKGQAGGHALTHPSLSFRAPPCPPQVPARFSGASGLQPFDLDSLLSMAQRSRKWQDPSTLQNSTVEQLQVRRGWARLAPGQGVGARGARGQGLMVEEQRGVASWGPRDVCWGGRAAWWLPDAARPVPVLPLVPAHIVLLPSCTSQVDTYTQRVLLCLRGLPAITDIEISAGEQAGEGGGRKEAAEWCLTWAGRMAAAAWDPPAAPGRCCARRRAYAGIG